MKLRPAWSRWCLFLCLGLQMGFPPAVQAHFQVIWPQIEGCYAKPGETVRWHYFWGHPFEMLIDDAQPPKVFVFTPQKTKEVLVPTPLTLKDEGSGRERRAFAVTYTPAEPGDYYLCVEAPAYFIPEDQVFCEDYVKTPLHVRAEKGWDQAVGLPVEILPITRPYGWPPGAVFRAQALVKNQALARAVVEIEKFHGYYLPPEKMPRDRLGEINFPLITRVTKTDRNGYFSCSFDSPGWWLISVSAPGGRKTHQGKAYPVELRGGLWIYVEPPLSPGPSPR